MDIVARAKGMIMRPREEWAVVAGEPADTKSLILGYAVPLAAIPAVVSFLTLLLVTGGRGIFGTLVTAIVSFLLGLVGLWVVGKIIEMLAPRFGGSASEPQAIKLIMYSYTAAWLASIFMIIPLLGWLVALLGVLYSLYTFYIGVPIVVRVPEGQAMIFTLAVIVSVIVIYFVIGMVMLLFAF